MWLKRFTIYLLNHTWLALALVFAGTFLPIVGIVGILFAALVTMQRGMRLGALFMLVTIIPYLLSYYFSGKSYPAGPSIVLWAAIGVAVLSNVLTWAFAAMLHRRASWSTVLQIAALVGVFAVSLIHLVYPQVADWWATQLQSYYMQAAALNPLLKSSASHATSAEAIAATKQYATGLMIAAVLFNALLQLIIARWWLLIAYPATSVRLRNELRNIRLSHLASVLFVASLALSYWGNLVVLDVMPIVYMLFTAAGLSVVHYWFGMAAASSWFWLAVVYMVVAFALPVSLLVLAFIALVDTWWDLRKRLKRV